MTDKINIIAGYLNAFAYESLDVTGSVKSLTSSKYIDSNGHYAKRAVIRVEDAQLRYRYDGENPSATEGMLLSPAEILVLYTSANIRSFKAIRKGATSAKIFVTYEI